MICDEFTILLFAAMDAKGSVPHLTLARAVGLGGFDDGFQVKAI